MYGSGAPSFNATLSHGRDVLGLNHYNSETLSAHHDTNAGTEAGSIRIETALVVARGCLAGGWIHASLSALLRSKMQRLKPRDMSDTG